MKLTRRNLIAFSVSGIPLVALLTSPYARAADAPCKPVPDSDPVATALKYVPDASKAGTRAAKMGVEGKDQSCTNCQLFTPAAAGSGRCVMIASGCVSAKGWCTGWVKKA